MTIQIVLYLICQRYKFESDYGRFVYRVGLYLICQRYKFESESQRHIAVIVRLLGCI